MIDLYTHVLPGMDVGPSEESDSLKICRVAAENGIREIVAAPNVDVSKELDLESVERKIAALQEQLGDTLYLHRGVCAQIGWHNINRTLERCDELTINGHQYALTQFSDDMLHRGMGKIFRRFRDAGVRPILVSPERATALGGSLRRLGHWVESGCLILMSSGSLLGRYGERVQLFATRIMDAQLAHFVGSGARKASRAPRLAEAYDYVTYRWGDRRAESLFIDHPWAVLWGHEMPSVRTRVRRSRSWMSLLGLRKSSRGRRRRRRRSS